LYSHVDTSWLTGDGDEAFVRVGSGTRLGGGTRLGDADLTLALSADFVNLDTTFSDD